MKKIMLLMIVALICLPSVFGQCDSAATCGVICNKACVAPEVNCYSGYCKPSAGTGDQEYCRGPNPCAPIGETCYCQGGPSICNPGPCPYTPTTSTDTGEGAIPELSTMAGIVGIIVVLALVLRKHRK